MNKDFSIINTSSLIFSISIKIFLLLFCILILVFLMITIKQIHLMNKNEDFCFREPLIAIAKVWIYITIILAIIVILFI